MSRIRWNRKILFTSETKYVDNIDYCRQFLIRFKVDILLTFTGVDNLSPLEMEYHIRMAWKKLLNTMIPTTPLLLSVQPTYIIQAPYHAKAQAYYKTISTPVEMWEIQSPMLLHLTNIATIKYVPNIWITLDPISRDKSRQALDISWFTRYIYFQCKYPRTTHGIYVVLFILSSHT